MAPEGVGQEEKAVEDQILTQAQELCSNCQQSLIKTKSLCAACYQYQRLAGSARPRALIDKQAQRRNCAGLDGLGALTPREREVLHLLGEGLTSAAVAERLFISKRTVHFHCRNAYCKLQVHTLVQALNAVRKWEQGR